MCVKGMFHPKVESTVMAFIHLDCFGKFAIDCRNEVIQLYGPLRIIIIFCFLKKSSILIL